MSSPAWDGVPETMRAVAQDKYGGPGVLRMVQTPVPAVGPDDVLVRVHTAAVNPLDWHFLRADPFFLRFVEGLRRPKHRIRGADLAGTVTAVGSEVEGLDIGDEVFAECTHGAFAEFAAVRADTVAHRPTNLTLEQAAAVPVAGLTALQALRDRGKIEPGQSVLVNGAGGGVGHLAVQLARALGAARVTGVCSTAKTAFVAGLGADHVIDYTQEDPSTGGPYDIIIETAGYRPPREALRALAADGTYVFVGGAYGPMFRSILFGRWMGGREQNIVSGTAHANKADLLELKRFIEAGALMPHISRRYPLEEVPAAIRELEAGHVTGKLVVQVADR